MVGVDEGLHGVTNPWFEWLFKILLIVSSFMWFLYGFILFYRGGL